MARSFARKRFVSRSLQPERLEPRCLLTAFGLQAELAPVQPDLPGLYPWHSNNWSVHLDGDTAVVGNLHSDIHVYQWDGLTWTQQTLSLIQI